VLPRVVPLLLAFAALIAAVMLVGGALGRRQPAGLPGEGVQGRVTGEGIGVREKAEEDSPATVTLARGARVVVQEDLGRWYRVEVEGGASGYVPADGVERETEREVREKTAQTVLAFTPVFGVVAEDTDLLLGAYPGAPRSGRLESGTVVKIHAVDHDYFALAHEPEGLAYVRSRDVDLVPPDPKRPDIRPPRIRDVKDLTVVELPPAEHTPGEGEVTPAPGAEVAAEPEIEAPVAAPPGIVQEAALLSRVDPVFPAAARRARVSGMVVLDVLIGAEGRVEEVEVQRGLPMGLSEAAVEAVKRWQYRPAQGPSGPVASRKIVRIEFTLR
jgi:TonB family protein